MIRFIDLGKQIGVDDESWFREFAFFNTVSDQFITLNGSVVWNCLESFRDDYYNEDFCTIEIARFENLIADWVPERV